MPRGKVQPRAAGAANESLIDEPAVRESIDTGRAHALTSAQSSRGPDVQFHQCPPRVNVVSVALIAVCLALIVLAFLFWPDVTVAAGLAVPFLTAGAFEECRVPGCGRSALTDDLCYFHACDAQEVDETVEVSHAS